MQAGFQIYYGLVKAIYMLLHLLTLLCWVCIEQITPFQFTGLYTKEPHQRSCTQGPPSVTEPDLDNKILDFELTP